MSSNHVSIISSISLFFFYKTKGINKLYKKSFLDHDDHFSKVAYEEPYKFVVHCHTLVIVRKYFTFLSKNCTSFRKVHYPMESNWTNERVDVALIKNLEMLMHKGWWCIIHGGFNGPQMLLQTLFKRRNLCHQIQLYAPYINFRG